MVDRPFKIAVYALAGIFAAGAVLVVYQLNRYNGVRVQHSVEVDAYTYQIWPFLIEPEKRRQWQTGLTNVTPVDGRPGETGSRSVLNMRFGDQTFRAEEMITDLEEDRWLDLEVQTPGQTASWTYRLVPLGDGSDARVALQVDAWHNSWVLRVQAPFIRGKFENQVERDLRRLKNTVESQAPDLGPGNPPAGGG